MEKSKLKAINFDLDTKAMKEHGISFNAYNKLRKTFERLNFEHRQGSGYVSKQKLTNADVTRLIENIVVNNQWLPKCLKQMDVTDIGKQWGITSLVTSCLENQVKDIPKERAVKEEAVTESKNAAPKNQIEVSDTSNSKLTDTISNTRKTLTKAQEKVFAKASKKEWIKIDKTESGYAESSFEVFEQVHEISLMKSAKYDIWHIGRTQNGEQISNQRVFFSKIEATNAFEGVKDFVKSEIGSRKRFENMTTHELITWSKENGSNPYCGESVYKNTINAFIRRNEKRAALIKQKEVAAVRQTMEVLGTESKASPQLQALREKIQQQKQSTANNTKRRTLIDEYVME